MSDAVVEKNKVVSITYQIRDEAGEILENIDVPVSYVHGGSSDLIEKVETALGGLKIGDCVDVTLEPEEAFGPHDPDLTFTDDLDNVPPQFRHIGAEVQMQNDEGDVRSFHVSKIDGDKLTVDGNHPMAGKRVVFTVTVTAVREASETELAEGVEPMPGAPSQVLH